MVILTQTSTKLFIGTEAELLSFDKTNLSHRTIQIPQPILPPNPTKGQEEVIQHGSKVVTCVSHSNDGRFIAVSIENKQVVLYDQEFNVVRNFVTNRAVSRIRFSPNNDLLLADKTGDVTLYKVDSEKSEILLGHLSMLLDVKLSDCGKYIITCDRDEKIRVSHFPNAYNIQSYCLGHKEFVTNVEVCGDLLISASGDGYIRFWDFVNGALLSCINTNDNVEDKSSVQKFREEMDKDSVEVLALPIRDMQMCKMRGNSLMLGVSLVYVQGVMLYEVENSFPQIKTRFLRNVTFDADVLGFSLGVDLFVLTLEGLECYRLKEGDYVKQSVLTDIFDNFNTKSLNMDDVSVLYKRKYDNVQEYLERKKVRLEGKE